MEFAERICGCRPWDYPTSTQVNNTQTKNEGRICDFFGNSCFNKILREKSAPKCETKCVSDCNKITYSMDISEKPLDPKKKICSSFAEPLTNLELRMKRYIQSLFNISSVSAERVANIPPERGLLTLVKDVLMKDGVTYYSNETQHFSFERDCVRKLESDIAVVVVSIDSPIFSRVTKRVRATWVNKISAIGKIFYRIL